MVYLLAVMMLAVTVFAQCAQFMPPIYFPGSTGEGTRGNSRKRSAVKRLEEAKVALDAALPARTAAKPTRTAKKVA